MSSNRVRLREVPHLRGAVADGCHFNASIQTGHFTIYLHALHQQPCRFTPCPLPDPLRAYSTETRLTVQRSAVPSAASRFCFSCCIIGAFVRELERDGLPHLIPGFPSQRVGCAPSYNPLECFLKIHFWRCFHIPSYALGSTRLGARTARL